MSSHSHNHSTQKEGSNNFLLGVLLGGGLALLLATDRGREMIRELSESGLDALENLEKKATKVDPLEEIYEEEIDDSAAPLPTATQIEREFEQTENDPTHPETQNQVRRFFKGVKKK